ncbi:DNA replication terminus site-binding protein [Marinobacterium aestuariivivens]|uniref:DNA replication terminus site-binding protein n=1 Tax=Marinobacterium aestuariivivens TaxID=1698799 RepID=A0ABW2A9Z1_9GAMM
MTDFIAEQYSAIDRDLTSLTALLRRLSHRAALVAPLPNTPRGMEHEPVQRIVVTEHSGTEAIELAAACYQDLHNNPRYSQKTARRTVGVLWLSPTQTGAKREIEELVERINGAKAAIEDFVTTTYHTRNERFEALRAACPGIMTLHLYRQIRCYGTENVTSIRFSWQRKDALVKPNKAELLQRIHEDLEHSGPDHQLPLEQLIQKVSATPEPRLRVRRHVKVQPAANIMFGGAVKTVTAPMPIIVLQDADLKLKMISTFDATARRKTRADRVASEILGTFAGITIEAFPD